MAQDDCIDVLRGNTGEWMRTREVHERVIANGGDLKINTMRVNLKQLAKFCSNVQRRPNPDYKWRVEYQYKWVPDHA